MLSFCKGKVVVQMPCGCNSVKVPTNIGNVEDQAICDEYLEEFVAKHEDICWNKPQAK